MECCVAVSKEDIPHQAAIEDLQSVVAAAEKDVAIDYWLGHIVFVDLVILVDVFGGRLLILENGGPAGLRREVNRHR